MWKWSKEAYHYTKLGENVQCNVCPNQCILEENERSVCRNKVNKGGKLYTLTYGNPCAVHVDPIEKKPLFHYLPGTLSFSIATAGCPFRCLNCQNWEISQSKPEDTQNIEMFPEDVVRNALNYSCASIAYTYSEPVAFYEYMYDTSKIAKAYGIKNLWITNGSINEESLRDLCKYIDAANVDLKSFKEEIYNKLNGGRLQPILNTLKILKEEKKWFEITNLVIPTYTDDMEMIREMCEWIVRNIGRDYPLHFSRFHPHYKLSHLSPTPVKTLENARKIAKEVGLKFVYIGNVPGHEGANTYCPRCEKILIERKGYSILQNNIENDGCKFCGEKISGVWKL
ncbi:MAG: AmmeMemoRadiSam system radical SAM enzyme [Candidatus Nanoarchaeia archaeon]